MIALANCDIYADDQVLLEHAVVIDGDRIRQITPLDAVPAEAEVLDLAGRSVAPGFIDLQVNGGGGVLLTDSPTVEAVRAVRDAHRRYGVTGFLPTFMTAEPGTFERSRDAVERFIASGEHGVLGVHFEGPFLNPSRAGVHDRAHMREPTERDLGWLRSPSGSPTMLTVAPEMLPEGWLQRLAAEGVILSIGHTAATYEQAREALVSGARASTHLFNAMSAMESRAPGVVGAGLVDRDSFVGVIADGFHVHFATLRVAWQAKEPGRMLLVTDAMPPVGGDDSAFRIGTSEIEVRKGRCTTADGTLAGSSLDMAGAVRNLVQQVGVPRGEALRMASLYPATLLGLERQLGRVAAGYLADLVIFDDEINVAAVVQRGEPVEVSGGLAR